MSVSSDVHALWEQTLERLRAHVDAESLQTWLMPVRAQSFQDSTLIVTVPSRFYANWLAANFRELIARTAGELVDAPVRVSFQVQEAEEAAGLESEEVGAFPGERDRRPAQSELASRSLNPRYDFDHFVIGESNRFAHAAAVAVADPVSRAYNPLFIYGGVGLGKTHLMHAIGNQLVGAAPGERVLYVTSEQFMNAFIDSISSGRQLQFRALYRNVDLLLLDDIQFFTGKERTQTEFFHTFNALYDAGKKIVASSDRPPKEIKALEERLRSRFEWGLIVDIQPPDLETRVAILKKKAESEGMNLPSEVTLFVAEHIKSNIRELEGSLQRIKAYATLENRPIDIDLARLVLSSLMVAQSASQRVSVDRIQDVVCEYFDVKPAELVGESRMKKYATPRHIAQYLCRQLTDYSYPEIGHRFGGRDHTSVMHAVRKIEKDFQTDSNIKNIISYLIRRVGEE